MQQPSWRRVLRTADAPAAPLALFALALLASPLAATAVSAQAMNAAASATAAAKPGADRLTIADYFSWQDVANPQLSPDGQQVHLHAHLDRRGQRQARIVALDHERRRHEEPLPRQGLERQLVAGRHAHRVPRAG